MKVLKFGGTSVGSVVALQHVLDIIKDSIITNNNKFPVVICSALSGVTNKLVEASILAKQHNSEYKTIVKDIENLHLNMINELINIVNQSNLIYEIKLLINQLEDVLLSVFLLKKLSTKTEALILSFGEQISCQIIAKYVSQNHINARYVDARNLIKTNNNFTNASVDFVATNTNLQIFLDSLVKDPYLPIITGFIASTMDNETTVLGRGGSDYTASIIGAGIKVSEIEIWTDVDGIMTTDPKQVNHAYTIPDMSYQEAMELSHFGAKIIYSPTIYPAFLWQIPIIVKNTFNKMHRGTTISHKSQVNSTIVKGVSSIDKVAVLNIQGSGIVGVTRALERAMNALNVANVSIILATQTSSECALCIVVVAQYALKAESALNTEFDAEITAVKIDKIIANTDFSLISIVGDGIRHNSEVVGRFVSNLGKYGINSTALAQSSLEISISVIIVHKLLNKALNIVHDEFFTKNLLGSQINILKQVQNNWIIQATTPMSNRLGAK